MPPTLKRLIAVATCNKPKFVARALSQRNSWVGQFRGRLNTEVRFFVGEGAAADWHTQLEAPDTYERLPEKTQAICKWAIEQGYDYLFKTDDDTFLNIEELLDHCEVFPHHYVGNVRGATGGHPFPYASGYAYWLSRQAMQILAEAAITEDPNEDRWVGNTLAAAGILPKNDQEHYRILYPGIENPRIIWEWKSNIGHLAAWGQLTEKQMALTHKAFNDLYKDYCRVRPWRPKK